MKSKKLRATSVTLAMLMLSQSVGIVKPNVAAAENKNTVSISSVKKKSSNLKRLIIGGAVGTVIVAFAVCALKQSKKENTKADDQGQEPEQGGETVLLVHDSAEHVSTNPKQPATSAEQLDGGPLSELSSSQDDKEHKVSAGIEAPISVVDETVPEAEKHELPKEAEKVIVSCGSPSVADTIEKIMPKYDENYSVNITVKPELKTLVEDFCRSSCYPFDKSLLTNRNVDSVTELIKFIAATENLPNAGVSANAMNCTRRVRKIMRKANCSIDDLKDKVEFLALMDKAGFLEAITSTSEFNNGDKSVAKDWDTFLEDVLSKVKIGYTMAGKKNLSV